MTLLMSLLNNNLEVARLLLSKGANVNADDFWGRTPLWAAVEYRNLDMNNNDQDSPTDNGVDRAPVLVMIKELIDAGANVNARTRELAPVRRWLYSLNEVSWVDFIGQTPFMGGAVMEADWNGKILWELKQPDHHHDGRLLRNGNVLLLCSAPLPSAIARRVRGGLAGSEQPGGTINSDYLLERTPDGRTVWEWRAWEHMEPEEYPITSPSDSRTEWTHGNGIAELPDGNILLSFRQISTLVRINRRTGNIDWKLGPPPLSGQHAPVPLPNGNILLFDNGPFRIDTGAQPFSRALEINPATKQIEWTYQDGTNAGSRHFFFSSRISNAERLANGNTLINEGLYGRFFEVTSGGDVVWEYVNPNFGPATTEAKGQTNNVFRVYRYTPEQIAAAQKA